MGLLQRTRKRKNRGWMDKMSKQMKNDETILELKRKIVEKKKELKSSERFAPLTNCSIELDGVRSNIQVLSKEQLTMLLLRLTTYKLAMKEITLENFNISGFEIDDWIFDVKSKLATLTRKEEEQKLRQMEQKLHNLLSNDTKVELELQQIMQDLS